MYNVYRECISSSTVCGEMCVGGREREREREREG